MLSVWERLHWMFYLIFVPRPLFLNCFLRCLSQCRWIAKFYTHEIWAKKTHCFSVKPNYIVPKCPAFLTFSLLFTPSCQLLFCDDILPFEKYESYCSKRLPQWPRSLRPFTCWNYGFESHWRHEHLSPVIVVCCQVEVSATGRSLVQRSPTECMNVSGCDWRTSNERPGFTRAVEPQKKQYFIN